MTTLNSIATAVGYACMAWALWLGGEMLVAWVQARRNRAMYLRGAPRRDNRVEFPRRPRVER